LKPLVVTLAATCVGTLPNAAHAEPDQTWTGFFLSGKPAESSKLLLWFDGHARFRDGAEELDVSILRGGLGWRVNKKLDVYAGYAAVTQYRDAGNVDEQRIWQQMVYPIADIAGGKLTGRTRLEQRLRETGDDTGWRIRQFVRYGRPIGDGPFGIVIWDEVFFGLNDADWGQREGFDQNRLFLGGTWQATPKLRFEAGYLNQHIDGSPSITRDSIGLNLFASF
jgi:hypothetical protein